ncbi:MAG: glutathione S-transferase family protein [Hyphomicrobiales bacterium]|nr:glutathione S-transferase family protein [Hyphomicrobiales bacterium]
MARLALVEKGVDYTRQTVDIMGRAEQSEPWYTTLNPRAVVPTLKIDDEVVTDTIRIVTYVDAEFDGPALTPKNPEAAATMAAMMGDIMGLHYRVLLYAKRLDENGRSQTVIDRGRFLRQQRGQYPDRSALLDRRITGNEKLQTILADPDEVSRHESDAAALVDHLDDALAGRPFVGSDTYSLADTFATPALARFRLHGYETWWSDGRRPNVAAYYRRMEERPNWVAAEVIDTGDERDI